MPLQRRGLSLVELLVVFAVIGIMLTLMLPSIQRTRESARLVSCQNNLRQMALAIHSFHSANNQIPSLYNGSFTHGGFKITYPQRYWDEYHFHSWQTKILPQLDQSSLYSQIDFSKASSDPTQQQQVNTELEVYVCPSTGGGLELPEVRKYVPNKVIGTAARTDYESIGGINVGSEGNERRQWTHTYVDVGVWGLPLQRKDFDGTQFDGMQTDASVAYNGVEKTSFRLISDGLSRTAMIGERSGRPELFRRGKDDTEGGNIKRSWWAISGSFHAILLNPDTGINERNWSGLYSFHTEGANVAFADGSVRLLAASTDTRVLHALATRAGGEVAAFTE